MTVKKMTRDGIGAVHRRPITNACDRGTDWGTDRNKQMLGRSIHSHPSTPLAKILFRVVKPKL